MKDLSITCSKCGKRVCHPSIAISETPAVGEAPPFCPMKLHADVMEHAVAEYDRPEVREFARQASIQEGQCYEHTLEGIRTAIPRVEEIMQFAKKCGYKKLGVAFCLGLAGEAKTFVEILEQRSFEVVSVCCKSGAVPKERIGIKPNEKIRGPERWETMCNPILQAEMLNAEKVDLAVLMGLCVGHDTLFIRYCKVPLTILAVKDRVTGHNPLVPLYLSQTAYYGRLTGRK